MFGLGGTHICIIILQYYDIDFEITTTGIKREKIFLRLKLDYRLILQQPFHKVLRFHNAPGM